MHIPNLHWIVVEDGSSTVPAVERLLKRVKISYNYFYTRSLPGFPKKGWNHRNLALEYIRKHYRNYEQNAVVYFADDDNSYDIRVFNDYIRNVKTIGSWAVGLVGGALVEAPKVYNGVITGWNVLYMPKRKFGTDMAGFAVNLKLILTSNASFHINCSKDVPESCFLSQFNMSIKKIEPFGCNSKPKEIMVWHTKTLSQRVAGSNYGYVVEV